MSRFKKLSHAVWDCKYHLVWCPKYRYCVLRDKVGRSAREVIRELFDRRGVELLEGSIRPDHVHMVVEIPPKCSVSEVVGYVKGKSAVKLFDMHPGIRQRLWGRHFWSRGYCVSTIGLNEEEIRNYVRWQLEKDRAADQLKLWQG